MHGDGHTCGIADAARRQIAHVTGVVTMIPASAWTGAWRSRQRQRARRASSGSRIRHERRERSSEAKPPRGAYCRREERAAGERSEPPGKRQRAARAACGGVRDRSGIDA